MIRKDITLYCPSGDGVKAGSHTAHYKGIKDFVDNGNGTITFKTSKDVEITTPLLWRVKKGEAAALDALANPVEDDVAVENPAPAGNRARNRAW